MQPTAAVDEFGIPIMENGVQKQSYSINILVLIERMKNLEDGNRTDTLNNWQDTATASGVDANLFLKDKELGIYQVLSNARNTTGINETTAFTKVTADLIAIGTDAWTRIKQQEQVLWEKSRKSWPIIGCL